MYFTLGVNMSEKYIKKAYKFYAEMEYIPSQLDFKVIPNTPSVKTIRRHFGKWSDYIKACEFPAEFNGKDKVDTVYIGVNGWVSENYKVHFENLFINANHIIKKHVENVTYKFIHNQLVFVFTYKDEHYGVSFFNRYVEEYADKINIIKEVLKDLNIKVINLNKSGRWWEKHLEEVFK